MRINSSLFSLNKAFTLLELVIVLLILGALSYYAMPRFFVQESLCFYELKTKLFKANQDLMSLYMQKITQSKKIEIDAILHDLTKRDNPSCFFEYRKSRLIAHVGKKSLPFLISPQDFSTKPKIYCLVANDLCQKFWGKKLKK